MSDFLNYTNPMYKRLLNILNLPKIPEFPEISQSVS